jgi:hypothetical protein
MQLFAHKKVTHFFCIVSNLSYICLSFVKIEQTKVVFFDEKIEITIIF